MDEARRRGEAMIRSHFREIGVAERTVRWYEAALSLNDVLANSTPLTAASPAMAATLARPQEEERWVPAPEALPRGSSFCPDDRTLALRVAQARSIAAAAEQIEDAAEREFETADANKLTLQKGFAHYWYVPPTPFINDRPTRLADVIAKFVGRYGSDRPPSKVNPVRRHTNHGGFDQATSDDSMLLHALMAAYARGGRGWKDRARDIYGLVAQVYGAPEAPFSTGFHRKGPIRKAQPIRVPVGGSIVIAGEYTGYAPRTRNVWGVVLMYNILLRAGYDALASIVVNSGNWHGTEDELHAQFEREGWSKGLTFYNDDISSYDTNVSRGDQEALYAAFKTKWPQLTEVWDVWLDMESMPLLLGPIQAGELGRLHVKRGQTTSGGLWTSLIGTILNQCRCFAVLADLTGIDAERLFDMRDRGDIIVMCWGDDTVLAVPWDLDGWGEASESYGFPAKMMPGAAFLKKLYKREGWQGSASRAFQQTVWNEHGGRTRAIEMLGLYARLAHTGRSALWPNVRRAIFDYPNETLRAYRVADPMDIPRVLSSPMFLRELGDDLKANPFILQQQLVIDRVSVASRTILAIAGAALGRDITREGAEVDALPAPERADVIEFAKMLANQEAYVALTPAWETMKRAIIGG